MASAPNFTPMQALFVQQLQAQGIDVTAPAIEAIVSSFESGNLLGDIYDGAFNRLLKNPWRGCLGRDSISAVGFWPRDHAGIGQAVWGAFLLHRS